MTTRSTHRRALLLAPLAFTALLATTAAAGGCGGPSSSKPAAGNTLIVPGATNEQVTCNETPYDVALNEQEADGTGIVVTRGYVRGAMWVSCTGAGPDSFQISVQLLRNGLPVGSKSTYTARPNAVGYAASVFTKCVPGVYRLEYRYRWTLEDGVQAKTMTVALSETVRQSDCDA